MKLIKNSSESSRTSQRKTTLSSLQVCQYGYNIDKIHLGNQLQSWANVLPTHIGSCKRMALINPKCIGEPELCSRSCTDVRETRHSNSQSTESEKAEFHTPAIPNATRNCVECNSAENILQDPVHPNKSDIEASASFDFKSEGREEITEIADVPALTPAPTPAPALERIKEQTSHTPGSRKSMRKNFGKPASSFSDFYM